jgi:hypothetical protein
MPRNSNVREHLRQLGGLLSAHDAGLARIVEKAASAGEKELGIFLVSNDLWGGSGSIADQAGLGAGRDASTRAMEHALIELGEEQIRLGVVNPRTASWVQAFKKWTENGI